MKEIEINGIDALRAAAQQFIQITKGYSAFAFSGPMGSGKTTLIKAIGEELGTKGQVTSPTFALVNEYNLPNGKMLYHFDLYRITHEEELLDIGFEEYFNGNHYIFIEWADKAPNLLPDSMVQVTIEETGVENRRVSIHL
jgi:tRNA threonylcarbamoyladenosine biosynthesis protein TsaE